MTFRALLAIPVIAIGWAVALVACDGEPSGSGSTGGTGGEGGCPLAPEALFTLTITADDGPVPPDTKVLVSWSAAEEPAFKLDDVSTWKTLDDANIVCDVDRDGGPPDDLPALVCHLWTSGATAVVVSATGYVRADETFTPEQSERCDRPVPSDVAITLRREVDGGEH